MFQKIKTQKLMNALYFLFIFIRNDPGNKLHKELIEVFRDHFKNQKNLTNLGSLIRNLRQIENNSYRDRILKELLQIRFSISKFDMDQVRERVPIFRDILDQLLMKSSIQETEKLMIMASSVHNYPHYVINKFRAKDIWEDHISYYSKRFNEDFLNKWKYKL